MKRTPRPPPRVSEPLACAGRSKSFSPQASEEASPPETRDLATHPGEHALHLPVVLQLLRQLPLVPARDLGAAPLLLCRAAPGSDGCCPGLLPLRLLVVGVTMDAPLGALRAVSWADPEGKGKGKGRGEVGLEGYWPKSLRDLAEASL